MLEQCCELLSFFSIFGIQHNSAITAMFWFSVVNCFHFSVSLGYNTTDLIEINNLILLWIAFIFQYLWDTTQLVLILPILYTGCELLSFFSIFGIQHNNSCIGCGIVCVVNCFHFSVSLGYNTTSVPFSSTNKSLWIAFIFQYLWDTTQLIMVFALLITCCELLSFFSIFGIQHNRIVITHKCHIVVNCFHFSVSLGYNTTDFYRYWNQPTLWIAFIFQYLWDTTQHMEVGK